MMKIKYIFIFTLCMFIKCEIVYAQQDSLNLVWKIIFKAENKDTLSYNDVYKTEINSLGFYDIIKAETGLSKKEQINRYGFNYKFNFYGKKF